jgi:hypothetical protein
LLYKLRRKYATRTGNYYNNSTGSIKDTETNVYLLVVWNVKDGDPKFGVYLIECAGDFTWDEDKLWALHHQYNDQLYEKSKYVLIPWLVHGSTAMKTRFEVTYESDYKLDIFIYEGTGIYNMFKPMKIDPKRLVLSLLMLIILIYAVSLSIKPTVKLNIYNQCLNIDLVSPTYVIDDGLECHRPPDYKVYAGDITRSGFIIKSGDASFSVLTYKLQRRQPYESAVTGEDTLSAAHLLVVWRISESKELHTDVLLIEHSKALILNEGRLNKLYHKNHNWLKEYTGTISDTWSMDNNMTLKTTFSARNLKGNTELSISISEERDEYAMKPFCIDFKR